MIKVVWVEIPPQVVNFLRNEFCLKFYWKRLFEKNSFVGTILLRFDDANFFNWQWDAFHFSCNNRLACALLVLIAQPYGFNLMLIIIRNTNVENIRSEKFSNYNWSEATACVLKFSNTWNFAKYANVWEWGKRYLSGGRYFNCLSLKLN